MLNFIELKPTQKQYVVEVVNRFDHELEQITLSDMEFFHSEMKMTRDQGCPKLGYPNWLIKADNKVSKGVYHFPIPTESELEDFLSGKTERVVDLSKFSPMLKNVIKEYGLKP
jgi:hypothetical protein